MKRGNSSNLNSTTKNVRDLLLTSVVLILFVACDRSSSPEGRMSTKIEYLQREMIDSLKVQNRAILDSLGKIREDLRELRELKK